MDGVGVSKRCFLTFDRLRMDDEGMLSGGLSANCLLPTAYCLLPSGLTGYSY